MKNKHISPTAGIVITLWRVILLIEESPTPGISIKNVYKTLESRGAFGGTIPIKDSISLGHSNGFVILNDGVITNSEFSTSKLITICNDDIPSLDVLKMMIKRILLNSDISWLAYINEDISAFVSLIPENWIQLLRSAGLLNINDQETIDWWNEILVGYQKIEDDHLKKIGDLGEVFTLEFENNRLKNEGFDVNPFILNWVSQISDYPGYDIKSIRGRLLRREKLSTESIQIEVKASISSDIKHFGFHFSKNQYKVAKDNKSKYFIYCWLGINVANKTYTKGPYIVPFERIMDLFPNDNSEYCYWTECRLELDVSKISVIDH